VSYTWLGAGLISVAIATLQLPVIGLLDLWDSAWATGGGVITVFMAGAIFMYFGALKLAETLREEGFAMSPVAVTAGVIGITIVAYFVAGPLVQYDEEGVNVYVATIAWCICYVVLAGMLTRRTAGDVGQAYQPSLGALAIAFFVFSISGVIEIVGTLIVGNDHAYQAYGVSLWPFIVSGLVFLWASYEFNLLTSRTVIAQVEVEQDIINITDRDYIESIVAVTSLASRPEAIRPILDELEAIANANAKVAASTLTDVQRRKLVDIYYQLEGYLIEDDPLRNYSKENVREQVSAGFNAVLSRTAGSRGKASPR
jgi:hypothetical protein